MEPQVVMLEPIRIGGYSTQTSYLGNTIPQLWGRFMPQRKQIQLPADDNLYSVAVYPEDFFEGMQPGKLFERRAAVCMNEATVLLPDMEEWIIPGGLYAVFRHVGAHTDMSTIDYIFREWLPQNGFYALDARPHFEILGAKYKQGDPASEEDIYIPVRKK